MAEGQGPKSLGNGLMEINFIGEELQTFTGRFVKLGALTKTDLEDIIEDVNQRVIRLTKIASDLQADHLN